MNINGGTNSAATPVSSPAESPAESVDETPDVPTLPSDSDIPSGTNKSSIETQISERNNNMRFLSFQKVDGTMNKI